MPTHPKQQNPKKPRTSQRNTPGRRAFASPDYTPSEAWQDYGLQKREHEHRVRTIMRTTGRSRMFAERIINDPEMGIKAYEKAVGTGA